MLCFIELYIVENSGCANGIQEDNKDDESKAVFLPWFLILCTTQVKICKQW